MALPKTTNNTNLDEEQQSSVPRYDRAFLKKIQQQAELYDIQLLMECIKALSQHATVDVLLYATAYITDNQNLKSGEKLIVNDHDIPPLTTAMKGMGQRDLLFIIHSPGGDGNAASQIIE